MSKLNIEDIRFSSSSIDAFFVNTRPIKRVASVGRVIRIAGVEELSGFSQISSDTLVHVSQKDFWHLGQDNEGFFIERLVDDSEGPVKG